MNKIGSILFCCIFFMLILIPLVFMPFSGYQLTENRPPTPAPALINENGLNLSLATDFEEYFMDRFAGRVWMVDTYSRLIGGLFGISANEKVIMAWNNWLFFNETLGDYEGTAALSSEEMDTLINYLLMLKYEAEARGQIFII